MSKAEQLAAGANLRNVWKVKVSGYKEAHFATFPSALIEPCIMAGTSEFGCCDKCGAPFDRVTETAYKKHENWFGEKQSVRHSRGKAGNAYFEPISTKTLGWQSTCDCKEAEPRQCTVLDPFAGSGTTGLVSYRLQRDAILIEINGEYIEMAKKRIEDAIPNQESMKL